MHHFLRPALQAEPGVAPCYVCQNYHQASGLGRPFRSAYLALKYFSR